MLYLAALIACTATSATANIAYTCDSTIDADATGTCDYLNSTTAGLYSSAFNNVNANIYIEMGVTGLGQR